jgi:hypothetical protein
VSFVSELRVAVIDDDWFKREHMKQELDKSPHIAVVHAIDQDTAATWTEDEWGAIDFAVVDVFDDFAPLEIGTDLFSGVAALERLRDLEVRTIAITSHRHHPLVEHRVFQSGANYLYRRSELNNVDRLEFVLLNPDEERRPKAVKPQVLRRFGADQARMNRSVSAYEISPIYGKLYESATHRSVAVPRRTLDAFTRPFRKTNFVAPPPPEEPTMRMPAKWVHVRDYLLVLIGRKDAPPTQSDEHQDLWMQ